MRGARLRAVVAVRDGRRAMVLQVMDFAQISESKARALLIQTRWNVAMALNKYARCEFDFTVAQADMTGSYAQRHEQAIMFMMDALRCNRTMAVKLLRSSGGSVEKVVSQVVAKHRQLMRRRAQLGECEDEPVVEPVDSSDTVVMTEFEASSSEDYVPRAEVEEMIMAMLDVEENEIECLVKVFMIDRGVAQRYLLESERHGFTGAANSINAQDVAEAYSLIDGKSAGRLHKLKKTIMKQRETWQACRRKFCGYMPGRDNDPIDESFASVIELISTNERKQCTKLGCCRMGGKAKASAK